MAFITPQIVARTALGILQRESVLARTIWRNPVGPRGFVAAFNDTVSVVLPAYAPARTRVLRSGTTRIKDSLNERKIDLKLGIDVYKDIGVTDEQMSLDIVNFSGQVLRPVMAGIVERIGTEVATAMTASDPATEIAFTYASGNFWKDVVLESREALNKAHVPQSNRFLALGANLETAALGTDLFVKANESGGTSALEDATLGRKGGFTIVSAPELPPNEGYAYHQTALAMTNMAPLVPSGAPWGTIETFDGFAIRVVQIMDPDTVENRVIFDSWMGTNAVTDEGYFNANGVWVPAEETLGDEVTLSTSAAADDIIDATAHGFEAGQAVVFTELTGGTGLTVGQVYYVIAANLAANTFQVSLTAGGSAALFSADITAGKVRSGGDVATVRAVKIVGS